MTAPPVVGHVDTHSPGDFPHPLNEYSTKDERKSSPIMSDPSDQFPGTHATPNPGLPIEYQVDGVYSPQDLPNNAYVCMDDTTKLTVDSAFKEFIDLFWDIMDYNRSRNWKKKALTAFMIISSILVFVDLLFLGNIVGWIHRYALWMSRHIFCGTIIFILIITLCTLMMIPPQVLTFVCGYVYAEVIGHVVPGIIAGTVCSAIGLTLGALLAFLRARYMMRDLVKLFAKRYRVIRAADRAIAKNGWRVFVLLRLCPIIPFNGLNYIGGITDVKMSEYILSLVGILPITAFTVSAGATTENLMGMRGYYTARQYIGYFTLMGVGAVFFAVAMLVTAFFARKELERDLMEELSDRQTEVLRHTRRASTGSYRLDTMSSARLGQDLFDDSMVVHDDHDPSFREGIDDEEWFWVFA